jgi:hypothetical protein
MGGYVNFEKIVPNIPVTDIPVEGRELADHFKDLLKDMTALSHSFDGKVQHSEIVLNFKNDKENSLVQLVNLGTETAKFLEDQKKKNSSEAIVDTTATH